VANDPAANRPAPPGDLPRALHARHPLRYRGGPYRDRATLLADLAAIVNAELRALVQAGAGFLRIDEPSFVMLHGGDALGQVALFNRTVDGVRATLALHVGFGNLHNNSFASLRGYRALFPALLDARCDQFVFEVANREMAELDLLSEATDRQVAVGVVDVKAFGETPDEVAGRLRRALSVVPAERLWAVPDCGLWATPRPSAVGKLRALVAGARLGRRGLGLA